MSDGGKGSAPRPLSVDKAEFDKRWAATFGASGTTDPEMERMKNARARAMLDNAQLAITDPKVIRETFERDDE